VPRLFRRGSILVKGSRLRDALRGQGPSKGDRSSRTECSLVQGIEKLKEEGFVEEADFEGGAGFEKPSS